MFENIDLTEDNYIEVMQNCINNPGIYEQNLNKIQDKKIRVPPSVLNKWMETLINRRQTDNAIKLSSIQRVEIKKEWLTTTEENFDYYLLIHFLLQGANPFWDPIETTIFQIRPLNDTRGMALLGIPELFQKVWDSIAEGYKTQDNKNRLLSYCLQNQGKHSSDVEVINYINYGNNIKARKAAYQQYAPKIDSALLYLKTSRKVVEQEKEALANHMKDLSRFNSRQIAFLHIHYAAVLYLCLNLSDCIDDLKILNKKLLAEWGALHPDESFPELKLGSDFVLEQKNNHYSTVSQKILSVKFDRILRKILIQDLKKQGLFPESFYLKFIGFVPFKVADKHLSTSLTLFSEGYGAPSSHTHYAHMIQFWLLVQAFEKGKISLHYLDKTFTFQEFFTEIFNQAYDNCYMGLAAWGSLFDVAYGISRKDKLVPVKVDALSFNSPLNMMSVIRQYHDCPELKALAHYIIATDIKRMNKLRALGFQEDSINALLPNPMFTATIAEKNKEINYRMQHLNQNTEVVEKESEYLIVKKMI